GMTASASLRSRSSRSAPTISDSDGTSVSGRMSYSRPPRCSSLSRVQVPNVVRRGLRRIIAQGDAAGLRLELRDRCLIGLGGGGELTENGAAALRALHGRRDGLIEEVLVAARETDQGDETNGAGAIHDILSGKPSMSRANRMRLDLSALDSRTRRPRRALRKQLERRGVGPLG